MARFFIIDHSLKDAGGHHFDYARCVSDAVESFGYAPIVATHASFRPRLWNEAASQASHFTSTPAVDSGCISSASIHPVFRQTTYQRDSYLAGLQHMTRSECSAALDDQAKMTWLAKLRHRSKYWMHHRRRDAFVRQFAADCARFFGGHPQRPGDHAFFTTVSELELMGLALYLSANPKSLNTHWHLQFHFNLFEGRTPEYSRQSQVADAISACFLASLSRLSYHSVSFYTTSLTLAEQYNRLGVGEFHALPYPIAPHFRWQPSSATINPASPMGIPFRQREQVAAHSVSVSANAADRSASRSDRSASDNPDESMQDGDFESNAVIKLPIVDQLKADEAGSDLTQELTMSPASELASASEQESKLESDPDAHEGPWLLDFSKYLVASASHQSSNTDHTAEFDYQRHTSEALRFTCPGGIRREKGQSNYLQDLVNELWAPYLSTGKVQMVVQRPKRSVLRTPKIELQAPTSIAEPTSLPPGFDPIQYVDHPLPQTSYVDLIRNTDVGLLFYDSRVYYSRRAGVLGELLACGKPVIVSAGSWLADQIQEPTFAYGEQLKRDEEVSRILTLGDMKWKSDNVPLPGGVVSFDRNRHPFEFEVECQDGESLALLEFEWHWPKESGVYGRFELTEIDVHGNEVARHTRVVGARKRNARTNTVFLLSSASTRLRVTVCNAFDDSTASMRQLSLTMLKATSMSQAASSESHPVASVGLIASDEQDLIRCVDEMVLHYDHYRRTAEAFAGRWYADHDPRLTVSHLLGIEQSNRRAA